MYKFIITFYFVDKEPLSFEFDNLKDIVLDLHYELYDYNIESTHWIIEYRKDLS